MVWWQIPSTFETQCSLKKIVTSWSHYYELCIILSILTRGVKRQPENRYPYLKPGTGLETEKPVVDFARVRTLPAWSELDRRRGREGGRGDHRTDPAPFPADDGTPTPPADDQHSRQWHAQNGWGVPGELDRGSTTTIGPRTTGRRITASPVGRRWTREGWAREMASRGRVSGAVAHLSKSRCEHDGGTRSPTGCWVCETTGPPSDAAGWWRSALGTFDVCCKAAVNSDLSCFLYTL